MISEAEQIALNAAAKESSGATPAALQRVAAVSSPELARWAFQQITLRVRAATKFAKASEMLFVAEALEQSSHEAVAKFHAGLFPAGELVSDLTAGIGADSIALGLRGPCLAFELDPERARYTEHNAQVHGASVNTVCGDSLTLAPDSQHVFADPARRQEGRRVARSSMYLPDPSAIQDAYSHPDLGVMKLSPLLSDQELLGLGVSALFVSLQRECKEALVLWGERAEHGINAVRVEDGSLLPRVPHPEETAEPEEFVFDPDPALVRAHAQGNFELKALGGPHGYLTGPNLVQSPWLRAFSLHSTGAFDPKRLREQLGQLGVGKVTLKQRGANLDLQSMQSILKLKGDKHATVLFWGVGRSIRFGISIDA